jgi:hypothetical protein
MLDDTLTLALPVLLTLALPTPPLPPELHPT